MRCEACIGDIPGDARFCPQCGIPITGEAQNPSKQRWLYDKGMTSSRDFVAERRVATVMFADISGFTSFSETADPEHLRDLINSCFHHLVPIIQKYGGQIDKFIGDEIMALFGASQANEDDPLRALEAAMKMVAAMESFSRSRNITWNLHVGINTGLMVTGMVGSSSDEKFTVIGDAVNVAARLAGQARPGEVLVGEKTCRLSQKEFDFEPISGVILKGKSMPMTVYRLKGRRRAEFSEPNVTRFNAPLFGRENELATLKSLLEGLEGGLSFILWVSGEAGVGKSRLLAEVRASSTLLWVEGKSVPMGRTISYWPFIQILRDFFKICDSCDEQEAGERLIVRMEELFPDDHLDMTPYIAQLMSISLPGLNTDRVGGMSAENLRFHIYRSVHRLFRKISEKSPFVLMFEDIHWADQSTMELIMHIASLLGQCPIGMVLIERSEETAITLHLKQKLHERFAKTSQVLNLAPLSSDAGRRLCETLLCAQEFKLAPVVEMVIDKSEGNPFFLEELLKALIDMNLLVYDPQTQGWEVQDKQMQIPESLSAVVLSRLDRMEDGVRDIVRYASVVGRSFLYKILLEMINDRESLENNLKKLLQIEVIRERLNKMDREYIFKHALFQKITYESILKQERKTLHNQVGRVIEILFHDRLDDFFGLLAYHYTQAEEWRKAHEYLQKAGEKAERIGADAEALDLYHQTLMSYQRAFGHQADPFDIAVMQRKMGEALFRKGKHHLAEEYLIKALEHYQKKPPAGRIQIRHSIFKNIITHLWTRISTPRNRPTIKEQPSPEVQELLYIRNTLGFIYFFTNRELYLLNALSGLNETECDCYGYGMLCSLTGIGIILDATGFFFLADRYFSMASRIASRMPNDHGIYYHLTAYHEDCRCNWKKAGEFYDKSIQLYRSVGEVKLWASAVCLRVELSVCIGEKLDPALELSKRVHEMGVETGDKQLLAWGLCSYGLVMMHMGQVVDALPKLEEAISLLGAIPDYYIMLCCCCHTIDCHIRQQELEKALGIMNKGEAIIKEHGLVGPFAAKFQLKKAELDVRRYEAERIPENRSLARSSCRKAVRKAKVFKTFLPEAYLHQSRLGYLDHRRNSERLLSKSISMAQFQGNQIALQRAVEETERRIHFDLG